MATFQSDKEELIDSAYSSGILAKFKQFREEEAFCDYVIKVNGHEFKVHKVVIAGCCDYFAAMFSHGMLESDGSSLHMKDISLNGLRSLLDFAYTGILHVNMATVHEVLAVAAFLQAMPALNLLVDFFKSKMTFENAKEIISLGKNYGLMDLANYHRNMVLERFLEFAETEQFLQLDPETLTDYLEQDALRTTTEIQLMKHVLKWYNFKRQEREPVIHTVLDRIRYTIDGWPAINYAILQPVFQTNKRCKQIIKSCEEYMQHARRKHLNQSYRTRVRYDRKTIVQFGGIMSFSSDDDVLSFILPGSGDFEEDMCGTGMNKYYHRDLNKWLPLGINGNTDCRSHNCVVSVNDLGILIGGYLYSLDGYRTMQHCTHEVKLFTPGDFAIWDLPYMLEARAHHVAVHIPGYIYVIGGKNEGGPLKSMEQYNLDAELWSFVKSLDQAVFDHAGAAYKDKVYISGGIVCNSIVNTVWCYDAKDDEWVLAPAMLSPRAGHTMSLIGNQFIVCGGHSVFNNPRCLASVEAYSHEVKQWTFITPMRMDCAYMSAVVLDEKLVILGGVNTVRDLLDKVMEYDVKTSKWSNFTTLPIPMRNMGCCALTVKLSAGDESEMERIQYDYYSRDIYSDEDDGWDLTPSEEEEMFQLQPFSHLQIL